MNQTLDGRQMAMLAGAALLGLLALYLAIQLTGCLVRVAMVLAIIAGLAGLAFWFLARH